VQTSTQIKAMLEARGLRPRKSLGQNFLIDHNLLSKLADASTLKPGDTVLEVGPGTGTLTEVLLERGARVIACELDRDLAAMLRETLGQHPQLTLIEGDCLDGKRALSPALTETLAPLPSFSLVANLPYGAATPLILILLTRWPQCASLHVTIQKEVAERLCAQPGEEAYGSISIVAAATGTVNTIARLPPECFWPRPGVESAMISIHRLADPLIPPHELPNLADLCQKLFTQRRKIIRVACRNLDLPLPEEIDPQRRVSELTALDCIALARAADMV
jgi:16S rRNA (adenine1518-N6/adenine1519-N6)-dimethyltransferase